MKITSMTNQHDNTKNKILIAMMILPLIAIGLTVPTVQVFAEHDGDNVEDGVDNCPDVANQDQIDTDNDGVGDACDPRPTFADMDLDDIGDDVDNCLITPNTDQTDTDGDGLGDACDSQNEPIFQQIISQIQAILASILGLDDRVTELENKIVVFEELFTDPALEKANKAQDKADKEQQKADKTGKEKDQEKADKEQDKACDVIQEEITKLDDKGITIPTELQQLSNNCPV